MKSNCFIAFCLGISLVGYGQTENAGKEKRSSIDVNLGVVHGRFTDIGYTNSSLLFRGTNMRFGVSYTRETSKYSFVFSAMASAGKVESKGSNLPSDLIYVNPSLEYIRRLKDFQLFGKSSVLRAGIQLSSINYYLENEPVFDNIDIFSLHGMYLKFRNRLTLTERTSLQVAYSLPLIVYENRVLWNGGASSFTYEDRDEILRTLTTHGQVTYFNLRNIQLKVDYVIRMGNSADFLIQYRFFYLNSFSDAPIRMYSNELLLGLKIRF